MIIGTIIGNVWATKKEETLHGLKLMVVQRTDAEHQSRGSFVAADCVGAGVGEQVLVVTGCSARKALHNQETPVDAAIIAIIDEVTIRPEE